MNSQAKGSVVDIETVVVDPTYSDEQLSKIRNSLQLIEHIYNLQLNIHDLKKQIRKLVH